MSDYLLPQGLGPPTDPFTHVIVAGDTVYSAVIATPGKAVAAFLAYVFDQRVIDGAVTWVGRGVTGLAAVGRKAQTGMVRTYALAFLVGVVAILWYVAARI